MSATKPVESPKRGKRTNSPGLKKFEKLASQRVREGLAKSDISLKELSWELGTENIAMDNKNLSRKIKNGTFSASLYIAITKAISQISTAKTAKK